MLYEIEGGIGQRTPRLFLLAATIDKGMSGLRSRPDVNGSEVTDRDNAEYLQPPTANQVHNYSCGLVCAVWKKRHSFGSVSGKANARRKAVTLVLPILAMIGKGHNSTTTRSAFNLTVL